MRSPLRFVSRITPIFLAVAALLSAGCIDDPGHRRLEVVVMNFPGHPALYSPAEYDRHLFHDPETEGDTYRETPRGTPLFGSARKWFLTQSKGLFSLTGYVHDEIYTSPESWDEIWARHLQSKDPDDGEDGEWWVAGIYRAAMTAMGRAPDAGPMGADSIMVIHNAPAPNGGWAWGNGIVVSGIGGDRDITGLGLFTHEIAHSLLGQPDRYFWSMGDLGQWDNMAGDYSHFPTGYVGDGRVRAGWAYWDVISGPEAQGRRLIPALNLLDAVPRLKARLDEVGNGAESFFSLEYRKAADEEEAELNLPAQGLMLIEQDASQQWATHSGEEGKTSQYSYLHPQRTIFHQINQFWNRTAWAIPYVPETSGSGDRAVGSFTCANGASLNILGECLWEFTDLGAVNPSAVGDEIGITAHWRPRSVLVAGTDVVLPGGMAATRRAYFTTRGPLSIQVRAEGASAFQAFASVPESSADQQVVVDLDGFPGQATLRFSGAGAEGMSDLTITERTGSTGAPSLTRSATALRTGTTTWTSRVASLGADSSAVIRLPGGTTGAGGGVSGQLRLVMALAGFGGIPESAAEEEETNEVVTVKGPPFVVNPGSLTDTQVRAQAPAIFTARIEPARNNPIVVLVPVSSWWVTGGGTIPIVVERGEARAAANLVVLAADFVPTPPEDAVAETSEIRSLSRALKPRAPRMSGGGRTYGMPERVEGPVCGHDKLLEGDLETE